jgi:sulfotransferase famil protein
MARPRVPVHVLQNAIALDDVELLYVPVPRSGSTAVLWALAESEQLPEARFFESGKLEVTRALTVHDLSLWGEPRHLAGRSETDRDRILSSDAWLRFTVIREPVRRIWSAWLAKVLLRDPRFVRAFGAEDWFPGRVGNAREVVAAFRRFVAVLGQRPAEWHDPHWSAQADLAGVGEVAYSVLARMEELPAALAPVDDHLGRHGRRPLALRCENASLLPFTPGLLDGASAEALDAWTRRDRAAFGYPELSAGDGLDAEWLAGVEAALPAIRAVADRNERIGDLRALLRRSRVS